MNRHTFIIIALLIISLLSTVSCQSPAQAPSKDAPSPKSTASPTATATQKDPTPAKTPSDEGKKPVMTTDTGFVPVGKIDESTVNSLVSDNNKFAVDLYKKLAKEEDNIFFSPYSVSLALAMTYLGANGNTASEMSKALNFQLKPAKLHPAFQKVTGNINEGGKKGGYSLLTANRLWGAEGSGFLDSFLKATEKYYNAKLQSLDFEGNAEESRKTINEWVSEKTKGKIPNLLPKGIITGATKLVLTNAIYFKGDWLTEFDKKNTTDEKFNTTPTEKIDVKMMHKTEDLKYKKAVGLAAVSIPYKGKDISMIILLPDKIDGINDLDKNINAKTLESIMNSMRRKKVSLSMPRFKATGSFNLGGILSRMGMPVAFSKEADFSKMNGGKNLKISAIIHKAFVAVDEKGTEAAAATAVVMSEKRSAGPGPKIIRFKVDRPFIFLLKHEKTGSILFMGRINKPKTDE